MALGLADRAARRAKDVHAAVADALAEANSQKALNRALLAVQSEAAKARRRRPAQACLIDAELAGWLSATAAMIYAYKPPRPAGCPRVPGPDDLLAVYEDSRARTEGTQQ